MQIFLNSLFKIMYTISFYLSLSAFFTTRSHLLTLADTLANNILQHLFHVS